MTARGFCGTVPQDWRSNWELLGVEDKGPSKRNEINSSYLSLQIELSLQQIIEKEIIACVSGTPFCYSHNLLLLDERIRSICTKINSKASSA